MRPVRSLSERVKVPLAALGHRRLEQGVDVRTHVHESRLDGEAALAMCDLQRLVETMGHLLAYRSLRLGHRHPAHVNAGNADSSAIWSEREVS